MVECYYFNPKYCLHLHGCKAKHVSNNNAASWLLSWHRDAVDGTGRGTRVGLILAHPSHTYISHTNVSVSKTLAVCHHTVRRHVEDHDVEILL
jgi:hypothetical protein